MKQPKLPRGVCFIDKEGFKIPNKKGWEALEDTKQEIVLRVAARGIPRKFVFRGGEIVRVLFGEENEVSLLAHMDLGKEFEEAFNNFVGSAIAWAKETRRKKEEKIIVWRRLQIFSGMSRAISPKKPEKSPSQSRLAFKGSIPRPR